jgi:hypothetical protein
MIRLRVRKFFATPGVKVLLVIGFVALSFVASIVAMVVFGVSPNNAEMSTRGKNNSRALHEKMLAEIASQRGAQSMFPDTVSPVRGHAWPCTPNPADLPRIIRLIESLDDDRTPDTMVNIYLSALQSARGIALGSRSVLSILKTAPGLRLVRVIPQKPFPLAYQRTTAESCWIASATIGASQ